MSLSQILIKKLSKIATLYLCIGILIILFVTIYVQSKIIQNNDIKKIDALNRVIAKSYAVGDLILIQQLLATNFSAENWENVELLDIDGNIIWNKQVIHSDVGIINSLFIVKYDIPIFYNNGEKAAYIIVLKNLADELSLGTRFLFYLILFFVLFWFTFLFYANSNIQTLLSPLSRLAKDLDMQRKKYGITNVLKEDHNLENGDNEVHRIHKWYFEVIQLWQESTKKAVELSKYEGMALISSQVSHDIRSPIAALGMILNSLVGIPEDQRIVLRNAVNRIKDIANDLHINHRKHINNHNNLLNEINEPRLNTTLISTEIENIISEKRIQFRDFTNISI